MGCRVKIPRVSTGPLCWSVEDASIRLSISQFFTFVALSGIFFWLESTQIDKEDESAKSGQAFLLTFAILFIIPALFAILLFVGLLKENRRILRWWIIYGLILTVLVTVGLLALAFWYMSVDFTDGLILAVIFLIIGGYMFYNVVLVNSVSLNIKERTERMQQNQE